MDANTHSRGLEPDMLFTYHANVSITSAYLM
jgi:hypothetical protein